MLEKLRMKMFTSTIVADSEKEKIPIYSMYSTILRYKNHKPNYLIHFVRQGEEGIIAESLKRDNNPKLRISGSTQ